jgi:hypothetical protein
MCFLLGHEASQASFHNYINLGLPCQVYVLLIGVRAKAVMGLKLPIRSAVSNSLAASSQAFLFFNLHSLHSPLATVLDKMLKIP